MRSRSLNKVLIISGCPGAPHRYRCENKKEQLESLGHSVTVKNFYDGNIHSHIHEQDIVILYRVPYNLFLNSLILNFRKRKIPVVFDIDDMVFILSLAPYASALSTMSLADVDLYIDGVHRYNKTIKHVDYALVSTTTLKKYVDQYVSNTYLLRNVYSMKLKKLCNKILKTYPYKQDGNKVILGYLSGSPTHDNDFQEICYPLQYLLSKNPSLELWLVGSLKLPQALKQFKNQVKMIPFVDWEKLPGLIAQLDINLAPLERDNPHCQAKSTIKYLEAGLLKIPTVASSTEPFRQAIKNGTTGFVANSGREWTQILESLILSMEKRKQVGQSAYNSIISVYNPKKAAKDLESILNVIVDIYNNRTTKHFSFPGNLFVSINPRWLRKVSDRVFWLKTIIRNLKYSRFKILNIPINPVVLGELRETRSIGQVFLHPGGQLTGLVFPVNKVAQINTGNIKIELSLNDTPVDLANLSCHLSPSNISDLKLEVAFDPIIIPPLTKVRFRICSKDPYNGTGLAFFHRPFTNSRKYKRYHNDHKVNGALIFHVLSKNFSNKL